MAYSAQDIKNNYPLPVYNFRVVINNQSMAFSNVSGLSIGFETHTFKESPTGIGPGPMVRRMPAQKSDVKIILKKGLVKASGISVLYEWINSAKINQINKLDITVQLLDELGNPVFSWTVINAFPTKLDIPTFDATSNDVAIENMELTADTILVI